MDLGQECGKYLCHFKNVRIYYKHNSGQSFKCRGIILILCGVDINKISIFILVKKFLPLSSFFNIIDIKIVKLILLRSYPFLESNNSF